MQNSPSRWKSHPEDEDELEGVIEWEPVDSIDSGLDDGEEGIGHPVLPHEFYQLSNWPKIKQSLFFQAYRQPLSVIRLGGAKQRFQAVIGRDDEACSVDEELASDVEEDEEKVESAEAENDVDLGHACLLLEIVESGVLG